MMARTRAAVRCAGGAQAFSTHSFVTAVAIVVLAHAGDARAQDRPIGLLMLPQVFGEKPCVPFTPRPIPLFASPSDVAPIAHIRVNKDWTFHEDGDCTPLDVRTYHADRSAVALPARESKEGRPTAVVVARAGEWFRIVTGVGPLWLRRSPENKYEPIEWNRR